MIRIIKGSYGMRTDKTIKPINADNGPIALSADEEERLVRLGVAVKVADAHIEREVKDEKKAGKTAGKKGKEKPEEPIGETEEEQPVGEDLPDLDASDAVVDG